LCFSLPSPTAKLTAWLKSIFLSSSAMLLYRYLAFFIFQSLERNFFIPIQLIPVLFLTDTSTGTDNGIELSWTVLGYRYVCFDTQNSIFYFLTRCWASPPPRRAWCRTRCGRRCTSCTATATSSTQWPATPPAVWSPAPAAQPNLRKRPSSSGKPNHGSRSGFRLIICCMPFIPNRSVLSKLLYILHMIFGSKLLLWPASSDPFERFGRNWTSWSKHHQRN